MTGEATALLIKRKSGGEKFRDGGRELGIALLDFWQWSASDLVSNTMRGVLAEYIVAEALGIAGKTVRNEWGAFDLQTNENIKVEVKSAAYVQSWRQERHSVIQFGVAKRRHAYPFSSGRHDLI